MVIDKDHILALLHGVKDPEIPVISIVDLGIVRDIRLSDDQLEVIITPTYSGCPAMLEIEKAIHNMLKKEGIETFKISTQLAPPWTTEWMTDQGKQRLEAYGIAPPNPSDPENIACPQCGSKDTQLLSEFGSTACKSLFKCNVCLEPFDYFKCH